MVFDLIVLAALLLSCLIGFLRGFIREVLTILGVIGGVMASLAVGPLLAPTILGWLEGRKDTPDSGPEEKLFGVVSHDMAANLIAYGGVFIVVVIILSIISHMMSGFARKVGLGAVDRTLGIFFGVVRALVLLALPFYAVTAVAGQETVEGWTEDSHTRVYIEATANQIGTLIPKSVSDDADEAAEKAGDKADKASKDLVGATRRKLDEVLKGEAADRIKDAVTVDKTPVLEVKPMDEDAGLAAPPTAAPSSAAPSSAVPSSAGDTDAETEKSPANTDAPGYADPQRQQLDQLFQQETGAAND